MAFYHLWFLPFPHEILRKATDSSLRETTSVSCVYSSGESALEQVEAALSSWYGLIHSPGRSLWITQGFFVLPFWETGSHKKISHEPGWTQTHYVVQNGLTFAAILLPSTEITFVRHYAQFRTPSYHGSGLLTNGRDRQDAVQGSIHIWLDLWGEEKGEIICKFSNTVQLNYQKWDLRTVWLREGWYPVLQNPEHTFHGRRLHSFGTLQLKSNLNPPVPPGPSSCWVSPPNSWFLASWSLRAETQESPWCLLFAPRVCLPSAIAKSPCFPTSAATVLGRQWQSQGNIVSNPDPLLKLALWSNCGKVEPSSLFHLILACRRLCGPCFWWLWVSSFKTRAT